MINMSTKLAGYEDIATICCGDFGTMPVSSVYHLFRDRALIDDVVKKFYNLNNIGIDAFQVSTNYFNYTQKKQLYLYMYVYIYIYVCVCVYIYVYIYIYYECICIKSVV